MLDWRNLRLVDVCEFRSGSVFPTEYQGMRSGEYPFIKVSDMNLPANAVRIRDANHWLSEKVMTEIGAKTLPAGTVVFAKIGEAIRHNRLRILERDTIVDNNMMGAVPLRDRIVPAFLYYALSQFRFADVANGTALPYLTVGGLSKLRFDCPPFPEQRAIAHVLGTLDDKIELNRKMSETLEELARTLFKSWLVDFDPVHAKAAGKKPFGMDDATAALFPDSFEDSELGPIPRGWRVAALSSQGRFLNGLALQKYPEVPGDVRLPVIKIREMRQGSASGAAFASCVPSDYVVRDGDLLFSWSATLMATRWAGGDGALNQHIFKVTSEQHESWWMQCWIEHHLEEFRAIASDKATTMGHIQRGHLDRALVVEVPTALETAASRVLAPLLDRALHCRLESRTLAELRDTLLPKLLSGELRVPLDVADGPTAKSEQLGLFGDR